MQTNPHDMTNSDTEVSGLTAIPSTQPIHEEDGFDASEYVKQLIARMGSTEVLVASASGVEMEAKARPQGKPQATAPGPAQPPPPSAPSVGPLPTNAIGDEPAFASSLEMDPRRARLSPRTVPVDLEKLREAANLTSSSALHESDCKDLIQRAYLNFVLAAVCLGLCLLMMVMSTHAFSAGYASSLALLAVAVTATIRFSHSVRLLRRKMRRSTGTCA
jgi:hypothetical protein